MSRFSFAVLVTALSCGGSTPQVIRAAQTVDLPEVLPVAITAPAPLVPVGPTQPPVTLTASDGTGLRLLKLRARGVVDSPLAFTELAFTFENPSERNLEGTFAIDLPPGAAVSRFAMKLGADWQEGEVVELERARVAYEDFLHRKQDPALLEQAPGNQFTARVFPIPAHGAKEIVLSYSQEIRPDAPYAIPLRGLPEIGEIDVELSLSDPRAPTTKLKKEGYTPPGDLAIDPRYVTFRPAIRSGELALARVQPSTTTHPEPLTRALVLVDTSASRVLGFESELKVVSEIARLVGSGKLSVAGFDQDTESVFSGNASAFGETDLKKLRDRGALGASDLEQALAWARAHTDGATRIVLVTDGVATAGKTDAGDLVHAAQSLKEAGVERIDAIALGGIRDDATLHALTAAGLAHDGVVVDASMDVSAFKRRLTESTRDVDVAVEGASFVWPTRLHGMQAGDDALVYAQIPAGAPLRVSVAGEAFKTLDTTTVDRPLLERAWTKAKIASLLDLKNDASRAEVNKQIVALSVSHRVLTPLTGLLVLETDADYARFEIDRHALTDIMTVAQGKVALRKRTDVFHPPDSSHAVVVEKQGNEATSTTPTNTTAASAPAPVLAEARADADISTLGHGAGGGGNGQGFGEGHGRLGGAHQMRAPELRQGSVVVNGRLPPEVIQRIVRQNFGRFRLCYQNGLRTNASLQGRVSVRFTIARDGSVSQTQDAGSDLPDASVVRCVVQSFSNLSFPQPEGGVVTVVFPVLFSPGAGPTAGNVSSGASLQPPIERPSEANPYEGQLKEIMDALAKHDTKRALDAATLWHNESPADQMGIVALGEALEATGDAARAARAYGSLIDMFPSRADVRRFAGVRLERVNGGLELARDSFEKALAERPDHPSSHRLYAYALVKRGELEKAFAAISRGAERSYPADRFPGVDKVLHEDVGLIGAAWIKAQPERRAEIMDKIKAAKGIVENAPSLRFVLTWETDANDVDFHIYDATGHAYYGHKKLASGGELYADITTGYGPECFTIRLPPSKRSPLYTLQANYYSRGPMGFGMGKLEVIDHDGQGGLKFEEHPYVVMIDHAFVNLGEIKRSL